MTYGRGPALVLGAMAIVAAAAAQAAGADYVYLGLSPKHGIGSFINRGSLARNGDVVTTELLGVLPARMAESGGTYFVVRAAYDCAARTNRTIGGGFYQDDGTLLEEVSEPEPETHPIGDEMDQKIFAAACAGKTPAGAQTFGTLDQARSWFRSGGGR